MSKVIAGLTKIQGHLIPYLGGDRGLGASAVRRIALVHITQNNRVDTSRLAVFASVLFRVV
jgi:hypothetical protein